MLVLGTAGWALSFPIMKAVTLAQQAMLPDASSWVHALPSQNPKFPPTMTLLPAGARA